MRGTRLTLAWLLAIAAPAVLSTVTPAHSWAQTDSAATLPNATSLDVDTVDIEDTIDTTDVVNLANLEQPAVIEGRLRHMIADHEPELVSIIRHGTLRQGSFTLAERDTLSNNLLVVRGNADVHGTLLGNLVVLDGDVAVYPGASVTGDVLVLNGKVRNSDGLIRGTVRAFGVPSVMTRSTTLAINKTQRIGERIIGVIIWGIVLLALGVASIILARSKLDVVAQTASYSVGRSFAAGFVGQALLLPTFGILVAGLTVSIVGILLLPFVVVGYLVLAIVGLLGGYLAIAYAIGETRSQPQVTTGAAAPSASYRPFMFGLVVLLLPWIVSALFSWVPIAGTLLWGLAFLIAWIAVTIGFGAMLLSRAGNRTNFTGSEN